ncbi:metal-dependent transcriptional regulator [Corynebacterium sp. TAE3-ERU12]|uniref:metal-dependent transcriptional regulator n=1 Tax=Corynebacterium sp. TAE3-ERU12 TaxID=2849491 RepID=UPI001C490826|nr:metal-dependent transcriptional regulator [Corynebacterium sp. TAE3-ERU12]MBV7295178.1 metal-dependent transcriptional regulator [Corynebacterium sp. TAE3-ERU12]
MEMHDLSDSAQNYLKALWTLSEWSNMPVPLSKLAERLQLRPSSVSDQIRRLRTQGLVDHDPYGAVTLTPRGQAIALQMVRRHRLVETFLAQTLDYTWDEVHEDADRLEHAISDRLLERLDKFLGSPQRDPHGDPIPGPDGTIATSLDESLAAVTPGSTVEISRVRDADSALLRHLADVGVTPGMQFTMLDQGLASGVLLLQPAGGAEGNNPGQPAVVPVNRDVANLIRVRLPEA